MIQKLHRSAIDNTNPLEDLVTQLQKFVACIPGLNKENTVSEDTKINTSKNITICKF